MKNGFVEIVPTKPITSEAVNGYGDNYFGVIAMNCNIFKKVVVASWPGIYRVFGLELPKQYV